MSEFLSTATIRPHALNLLARDGYRLAAHQWAPSPTSTPLGLVVINPATAVKASYYHRYARYLTEQGFFVLTYDYRGIGGSRPLHLRDWKAITNTDWGYLDCEAALAWAIEHYPALPLHVVGHSIGGMVVGLAPSNRYVTRCFTVGAQFAYWPDYAAHARFSMRLRWHVLMPLFTKLLGYFPAKVLGWHEDLPAGAAYEWAFRQASLGGKWGAAPAILENFRGMQADILALSMTDDAFGTPAAIHRLLNYFEKSTSQTLFLPPSAIGANVVGHFAFFHERFRDSLWPISLNWLLHGVVTHPSQPESSC